MVYGEEVACLSGHEETVRRAAFSSDGEMLASVCPRNGFGLDFPGDFAKKLLEDVNHCLRGA